MAIFLRMLMCVGYFIRMKYRILQWIFACIPAHVRSIVHVNTETDTVEHVMPFLGWVNRRGHRTRNVDYFAITAWSTHDRKYVSVFVAGRHLEGTIDSLLELESMSTHGVFSVYFDGMVTSPILDKFNSSLGITENATARAVYLLNCFLMDIEPRRRGVVTVVDYDLNEKTYEGSELLCKRCNVEDVD